MAEWPGYTLTSRLLRAVPFPLKICSVSSHFHRNYACLQILHFIKTFLSVFDMHWKSTNCFYSSTLLIFTINTISKQIDRDSWVKEYFLFQFRHFRISICFTCRMLSCKARVFSNSSSFMIMENKLEDSCALLFPSPQTALLNTGLVSFCSVPE